jgi:hypothetical protein
MKIVKIKILEQFEKSLDQPETLEKMVIPDRLDLLEKRAHEVPLERILETLVQLVQREILV